MIKLYFARLDRTGKELDESINFSYCDFKTNTILSINPTRKQIESWDFKEIDIEKANPEFSKEILDWITECIDVSTYEKMIRNKSYAEKCKKEFKKNLMKELDNIRKEKYNSNES